MKKPLCYYTLKGKELRICYHPGFTFGHNRNQLDSTKYESFVLDTFVQKYGNPTTLHNFDHNWGTLNETTGQWSGMVENVGIIQIN